MRHQGALWTQVERKTLLTAISKLNRPTAEATLVATVCRLKPLRHHVHTITYDNGKEFAAHQMTTRDLKATIFFPTLYHAWERSVHENTNGLIRDFFPKDTDFSPIHPAAVAKVEHLLNRRPRKSLGFKRPRRSLKPCQAADEIMHCAVESACDKTISELVGTLVVPWTSTAASVR